MSELSKTYSCNIIGLVDDAVRKYSKYNPWFKEFESVQLDQLSADEISLLTHLMIKENKSFVENASSSNFYDTYVIPALNKYIENPEDEDFKHELLSQLHESVEQEADYDLRTLLEERFDRWRESIEYPDPQEAA